MSTIFVIMASPALTLLFLATYFSPVIVAFFRGNYSIGRIALLNLCFGWTGIGWIVCMAMAWKR
jgi:hypothetical protein